MNDSANDLANDSTNDSTNDSANDFAAQLEKYAQLVVQSGCNLKPGQELFINASTDTCEFARLLTAAAYQQGARKVTVLFADEQISRLHYENCDLEVFEDYPKWQALLQNSMAENGAAMLRILSEDPLAMVGLDKNKFVANARAAHTACKPYHEAFDQGRLVWCIVGAAAPKWASHVFPDLPLEAAMDKLWQAIFASVRVDQADPIAEWDKHRQSFDERKAWLNSQHFASLHYVSQNGTDLVVGLNQKGLWQGGGDVTVNGTEFFPNMPTEEIFTSPDRLRANGIVYSSMPLVIYGSLVEDFSLSFQDGKVCAAKARVGQDSLDAALAVDDGAARLGECALIPWTSPIRASGILFYNTLYDENASCHLALGKGFSDCFEGGLTMNEDELEAAGVNNSASHLDFMVGTADLNIFGIKADGQELAIFENGEWAF